MSVANLRMHEVFEVGMSQGRVGGKKLLSHISIADNVLGSYMKLDTSHTNIIGLLYALRVSVKAPKLSAEDKQVGC